MLGNTVLFAGGNDNRGEIVDSFTSMKTKLDATGLYSIEQGTNIYAELKAYGSGLDVLFETLATMLKELFIDTAEDYGISAREKLLGKPRSEFTLEKRREMLKIYEQMMGGKCTKAAFEAILRGYGLSDFSILEAPTRYRIGITVNEQTSPELQSLISDRIAQDFPTHLIVTINFPE